MWIQGCLFAIEWSKMQLMYTLWKNDEPNNIPLFPPSLLPCFLFLFFLSVCEDNGLSIHIQQLTDAFLCSLSQPTNFLFEISVPPYPKPAPCVFHSLILPLLTQPRCKCTSNCQIFGGCASMKTVTPSYDSRANGHNTLYVIEFYSNWQQMRIPRQPALFTFDSHPITCWPKT